MVRVGEEIHIDRVWQVGLPVTRCLGIRGEAEEDAGLDAALHGEKAYDEGTF